MKKKISKFCSVNPKVYNNYTTKTWNVQMLIMTLFLYKYEN